MFAPVVLTVYNRPIHTKKVLRNLSRNELASQTDLYIYSDGPKTPKDRKRVAQVRKVISKIKGFNKVEVIKSNKNRGLANSVISAVTEIINRYGSVIVLEDDLLVTRYFLNVMNQMLSFYSKDSRVGSVTAFMASTRLVKLPKSCSDDVFFNLRPSSYGWGTWKDRWEKVDWEVKDFGKFIGDGRQQSRFNKGGADLTNQLIAQQKGTIDSWAIRWAYHCFKNALVTVQTTHSYIDAIGYDSSGIHTKKEGYFFQQESMAAQKSLVLKTFDGDADISIVKRYVLHNKLSWPYIKKKLLSKFGIIIKF